MNSILILFFSLFLSTNIYAHGDEHKSSDQSGMNDKKQEVLSGKLIGLTCFIKHGAVGKSHKDCFKECAENGLPIGILTADKKIYQISGEGHADLKTTNKQFIKYAEQDVVVKGEVFQSNNMNMVVVKGIKLSK
ncbi:MAG: hypothetical protein CME71_08255 [Halobacteriovorax sp.]|nr:hypothetical protein [Halobacteriovorax sp.]|tara:strand:+ start:2216 stop:2617 length:402 start_codon:yes stop_codon:yes gene_type:complete